MNPEEKSTGVDGKVVLLPQKRLGKQIHHLPLKQTSSCNITTIASEESDECAISDESSQTDETSICETDKCVYLDYNATTPLDCEVLAAINQALHVAWGNPSSSHEAGINAKTVIKESRDQVAKMIGASAEEIIFTSGGTESNNLILNSAIKHFWNSYAKKTSEGMITNDSVRPHIVSSSLEHDSIKLVLEHFQQEKIADITFVSPSIETGRVEVKDVISAMKPLTCLVTVMLANNETGIIQPVAEIGASVSMKNKERAESGELVAYFHTDAAQAIGKIPVNSETLGVDYLTLVGHKFYGPRIGALYVKKLGKETGAALFPMFYGGGQERNFRPGTENTGMIAGLGKACELVTRNIKRYEKNMRTVRDHLEKQLELTFPDGVHFNGRLTGSERIPNTCNVSILGKGLEGHKVLSHTQKVQASVGAACHSSTVSRASPILLAIGIPEEVAKNAIRLSVGRHSTLQEVETVVKDIKTSVNLILSSSATC